MCNIYMITTNRNVEQNRKPVFSKLTSNGSLRAVVRTLKKYLGKTVDPPPKKTKNKKTSVSDINNLQMAGV